MTPACKQLKKKNIQYSIHEYKHDQNAAQFGLEAAQKLNLAPESVFKTLLVTDESALYVAVIPVTHTLSLKKAAKQFRAKKLRMANPEEAERSSGYLIGGISPIAQKKALPTLVDESAQELVNIYVSGGKRGLDIGLTPSDLILVCHQSRFADLRDDI